MKKNRLLKGALIGSCLFLFSCGAKVNLSEYNQTELDTKVANHEIPDYVLNKKKPKIAVLPLSVSEDAIKRCGIDRTAQETFMDTLTKVGTVEVVERSQVDAIMKEAKFSTSIGGNVDLSKLSGIGSGIDYVIVGSVTSAKIAAKYTEGKYEKDNKGNTTYIPPKCNEVAEVKIVSRILKFPAGSIVKSMSLEGSKDIYREVGGSYGCSVQDPCGLLSEATHKAVGKSLEELKATFPAYGYVYKTMTHKEGKKRIAFISIGTDDGIKAGDKVNIIEFVKEKDPVKNTVIIREKSVADCTVVETELGPDKSICLIEEEKAGPVLIKHAVKTKANKSLTDVLKEKLESN